MKVYVKFVPRDLWIGVYWQGWEREPDSVMIERLRVFVCLIPMLPVILHWRRTWRIPNG